VRIEVFFTPAELSGADIREHAAAVIDVLRATSVIAQAIASGARAIYPAGSMEEAIRLSQNLDRQDLLLCGERRGLAIEGFDLGNSPLEFTPEVVGDRTLVMATTNGTPALVAASSATRTLAASYLNLGSVAAALAEEGSVAIVCAGREKHFALEDAVCAGLLVDRLLGRRKRRDLNDGAVAALALANRYADDLNGMMQNTDAGRQLIEIGHLDDLAVCARLDHLDVVPRLEERRITA
jgi:2-phosphosulfolactate phosphatase